MRKIPWRLYLPCLYLNIDLGFCSAMTALMHDSSCSMERDYIALYLRFLKWHTSVALYDTAQRMVERRG